MGGRIGQYTVLLSGMLSVKAIVLLRLVGQMNILWSIQMPTYLFLWDILPSRLMMPSAWHVLLQKA